MTRLLLAALLLLAACSPDQVNTALLIHPARAAVSPGATVQFMVEGAVPVTWSVTESGGGSISASGLYTAPCPAVASTFHITASAGGVTSAPATATVSADRVVSVTVSPGSVSLAPLATQQFTATVTMACGSTSTHSISGAALLR